MEARAASSEVSASSGRLEKVRFMKRFLLAFALAAALLGLLAAAARGCAAAAAGCGFDAMNRKRLVSASGPLRPYLREGLAAMALTARTRLGPAEGGSAIGLFAAF
jgi:hypothetical protein